MNLWYLLDVWSTNLVNKITACLTMSRNQSNVDSWTVFQKALCNDYLLTLRLTSVLSFLVKRPGSCPFPGMGQKGYQDANECCSLILPWGMKKEIS